MAKVKKKKKLDPIPKINRRLFKLWSEAVRSRNEFKCEYCKKGRGDIGHGGNPINKIDAHHFMNRDITDCPLKFDIRNGIGLCPYHHKFSPDESFHMNPVITMEWLQKNRPDSYKFVLENYKIRVNLHDREILEEIEERLKNKEPLDLDKLISIDIRNKELKRKKEEENNVTLFDKVAEPNRDESKDGEPL